VILKDGMRRKMFSRRVANVGSPNSIYIVEVMAPHGEDTQQIQKVNRHTKIANRNKETTENLETVFHNYSDHINKNYV
jgi:hemolysin-activating ACP:hemolysin acyltransferase